MQITNRINLRGFGPWILLFVCIQIISGLPPLDLGRVSRGTLPRSEGDTGRKDGCMTLDKLFDRLEDNNDHGLCAMLAAVANRDYEAVIRIGEIVKEHDKLGHMPYKLGQERTKLMMRNIKELRKKGEMK